MNKCIFRIGIAVLLIVLVGWLWVSEPVRANARQSREMVESDPSFETRFVQHEGEMREYLMYLPSDYNAERGGHLLFVLHGAAGSSLEMVGLTGGRFNHLANGANVIVVYPQATSNTGWNDGRAGATTNPDDIGYLLQIADELSASHNVDPNTLFLTGMSSGGLMSNRMACEVPERVAAIAPVGALWPASLDGACANEPVPMMLFVGTADRLMPIEGRARDGSGGAGILSLAETELRWIATNGCSESPNVSMLPDSAPEDGTRVMLTSYDDCDALVEVFVVEDGGHTWPGGSERMRLLGKTNRDIDASEIIWLFFTEQGLVKYP